MASLMQKNFAYALTPGESAPQVPSALYVVKSNERRARSVSCSVGATHAFGEYHIFGYVRLPIGEGHIVLI